MDSRLSETASARVTGPTAAAGLRSRALSRLSRLEGRALAWLALLVLLLVAAVLLFHETRGTTFWVDEWAWALYRRGTDLDTFLKPHNQHLSLVPLAMYRLLFATAGLGDYLPYRALVIAAHLGCSVLVFVYAARRVGSFLALLAAALLLFLGPGWQDVLWPFQVAWLLSLAAGVAALLMLDRADGLGNAAACGLLALSLASSGIGLPIALGIGVEVLWGRRRWRDIWIVAAPLAAYALWWLAYQESDFVRHNVVVAPRFVADAAAGTIGALVGLRGQTIPDNGGTLDWGRPLAVAAVALLAWRLPRRRPIPVRIVSLGVILVSFWVITALNRAQISAPFASRYLYVGALFLLLLAAELARGVAPRRSVQALLAALAAVAVVSNVGAFRDGGRYLREQAQLARADLGALDVARPLIRRDAIAGSFPGYPFVLVAARPYFAAEDALGTPASSPRALVTQPEPARRVADQQLISIYRVRLEAARRGLALGEQPRVESAHDGTLSRRGHCLGFRRAAFQPAGARPALEVVLPPRGLVVKARGGPANVNVRRFAAGYGRQQMGSVAASSSATLRIAQDRVPRPWRVLVAPSDRATVCGLRR